MKPETSEERTLLAAIRHSPNPSFSRLLYADELGRRDLLAACLQRIIAEPRNLRHRLDYADELERAGKLDCPECGGRGREEHGHHGSTGIELCLDCSATGLVPDPAATARVELIRNQCRLAEIAPPDDGAIAIGEYACEQCWAVSSRTFWPSVPSRCPHCRHDKMRKVRVSDKHSTERADLTRRCGILLENHSEWIPNCPHCDGCGWDVEYKHERDSRKCPYCNGDEIGEIECGFLNFVTVTNTEHLWERKWSDWGVVDYCLTPFVRGLFSGDFSTVERVRVRSFFPAIVNVLYSGTTFGWLLEGRNNWHLASSVPEPIFDALEGYDDIRDGQKLYLHENQANLALWKATAAGLRNLVESS